MSTKKLKSGFNLLPKNRSLVTNEAIVELLELTTKLLELHGENDFKIRNFQNAAFNLDKTTADLATVPLAELSLLPGVGKSMASKIDEIRCTGTLKDLNDLLAQTPEGILDMFRIKGIGPKKIRVIWKELGITDTQQLLLACENGEIAKLKGFGEKTQETIHTNLLFLQSKSSKLRMDVAQVLAEVLCEALEKQFPTQITGEVRQKAEIVDLIQLVTAAENPAEVQDFLNTLEFVQQDEKASTPFIWRGKFLDRNIPVEVRISRPQAFINQVFIRSSSPEHLTQPVAHSTLLKTALKEPHDTEEAIYADLALPYLSPELRNGTDELSPESLQRLPDLITWEALKGTVHNHSTWSDGKHTLEQMARAAADLGLQYLGIADHSKSATYANGLNEERIYQQHQEIDQLNERFRTEGLAFHIFKGIESDILGDGSLDYDTEVLKTFDFVVASVHSNLKMTEEKAMQRLIRAIENPYTTIIGHPTGRLLLSRPGYPVDEQKLIDACAANGVVLELNASPYRLDADWRWIPYALEKGVRISINPDAHHIEGYQDMHYGVAVARKGGLTRQMTFNTLTQSEMQAYLTQRKIG